MRAAQVIHFVFHEIRVRVKSDCPELLDRLKSDFSQYAVGESLLPKLTVEGFLSQPSSGLRDSFPVRPIRTRNADIRDVGHKRFSDYSGAGWSVFDFEKESAQVFSPRLDRLHEITYLLILSRVGKHLDRAGLHRIHAMSIAVRQRALILLLPMKGGKTTLLSYLAEQALASGVGGLSILSDDSPLVSRTGLVRALALRAGTLQNQLTLGALSLKKPAYELDRMRYGRKYLFPIENFGCPVSKEEHGEIVLVLGRRTSRSEPEVRPLNALWILPTLFSQMVIGAGLPMMREYFIENRPRDYLLLVRIAWSRLIAAYRLLRRSTIHELQLSTDSSKNAALVTQIMERE